MDRRNFIKIALQGAGAGLLCVGIPMDMPKEIVKGLEFKLDKKTGLVTCINNTNLIQDFHVSLYGLGDGYSHLYIVGSTGDSASWTLDDGLKQNVIKGMFGR